ncbi:hypothetical protein ACFQPA_01910 [Halomarina halobia]|uniref:Uncharacterized protein n=1 Tax=Halomarina halobia TaxID=3033386 RepID=A0ABD6A6T9_9EURY|nr:hypothetical protein [Halomarina sp. PSR21]
MTLWVDVARIAILANVLLTLVLGYVWGRNYLQFRSKQTLGLVLFTGFLLLENLLALYFYMFEPTLRVWVTSVPPIAQGAMTALRLCEFGGLFFLTWVTWD